MSGRLKIAAFLAITFIMIGAASAETTINLTKANNAAFDGKIDIGVVYDGTAKTIIVQYVNDTTPYTPIGIDKFFYNLDNDIVSVNESGWNTNFDGSTADGFGKFLSKTSQNPGGTGGVTYPLIFTLDNNFNEPITPNSENHTIAIHIRFSDNKSTWVTDGPSPIIDIEKSTNGEDADNPTGPVINESDPVVWEYVVTNPGNVNLTNITVQDDILGTITNFVSGDTNNDGILEPGEIWIYNATGSAAVGQYANIANVTGEYNGINVTDEDPSHYLGISQEPDTPAIDIEKLTNGEDADQPTGPEIEVGGAVTWTYIVTNVGTVTLSNINVTDDKGVTVTCPSTTLAPGQNMTCTANGTAVEGQYANNATVTGDYQQTTVNDTDPSHYFGVNASIDIEKSTNTEDADTPTGPFINEGDPVIWEYVVTNIGNVNLTEILVQDNILGIIFNLVSGDTNNDGVMEPGEVWIYNNTSIATLGQYANIANVTGEYKDIIVNDSDPSHYFGAVPSIDIEKFTEGVDADEPTGPELVIGEIVEWTYVVTNNGTAPLTNVTVVDDKGVIVSCPKDTLAPGESMNCTATGTVGEGQYVNNATVTAEFGDIEVNDTDPSHYFGTAGGEEPVPATNVLITAGLLGLVVALFMRRER